MIKTIKKFEYKPEVTSYQGNSFIDFLNTQGQQGWELVYVEEGTPTMALRTLTFKRFVSEEVTITEEKFSDKNDPFGYIGKLMIGFKFERTISIGYSELMDRHINYLGVIQSYNEYNETYNVLFDEIVWQYPAKEIKEHLT